MRSFLRRSIHLKGIPQENVRKYCFSGAILFQLSCHSHKLLSWLQANIPWEQGMMNKGSQFQFLHPLVCGIFWLWLSEICENSFLLFLAVIQFLAFCMQKGRKIPVWKLPCSEGEGGGRSCQLVLAYEGENKGRQCKGVLRDTGIVFRFLSSFW